MMLQMRGWDRLMGLNARNEFIARNNPAAAIRLVNDKFATKAALRAAGIPTAPTLKALASRRDLAQLDWAQLPDAFAVKPNQGLGGSGVLLATGRLGRHHWQSASGRKLALLELKDHIRLIFDGEFSPRARDHALIEPLLVTHPQLAAMSFNGLPDIRVICVGSRAVTAMLRLPTAASGGRANLHQGAIGAAVDLKSGTISRAWVGGENVAYHPDTGARLAGIAVPAWGQALELSRRCAAATGLHYVGADVVIDVDRGPLVLEVNARPGLQIQNVTGRGLLDIVEAEVVA